MGSILSKIYRRKDRKILFLGLPNTQKTSTLHTLQKIYKKPPHSILTAPTVGFNTEIIYLNHKNLIIWDLGGDANVRSYWKCYFTNTKAVVFFIDTEKKVEEAVSTLNDIKEDVELRLCVFMVLLVHKTIDVDEEIVSNVKNMLVGKKAGVFVCKMGVDTDVIESFLWLTNQI